jgi:hypothetical protein
VLVSMVNYSHPGMVSVCASCDGCYPCAASIVAAIAGALYVVISRLVISIKVDDPLDAVAVHAGSGLWGILAAPIFMDTGSFFIIMITNMYIYLSRHPLHWLPVCRYDVGLECGGCCQFYCLEHYLWHFAVRASEGIFYSEICKLHENRLLSVW